MIFPQTTWLICCIYGLEDGLAYVADSRRLKINTGYAIVVILRKPKISFFFDSKLWNTVVDDQSTEYCMKHFSLKRNKFICKLFENFDRWPDGWRHLANDLRLLLLCHWHCLACQKLELTFFIQINQMGDKTVNSRLDRNIKIYSPEGHIIFHEGAAGC